LPQFVHDADRSEGIYADIELYASSTDAGNTLSKICTISYNCPWSGTNSINHSWTDNKWDVKIESNFNPSSGPLGHFTIIVSPKTA
jgi:hypothetical protein